MTASSPLSTTPMVQRASEAKPIRFSPTSEFRIVHEGGPGVPDFYDERSQRGDGPPLHRHPWPSWEMVIEGEIRVVVADEEFRLGPGDAIYVPPDTAHTYVVESESARTVGINLSDGRFPSLQRQAEPLLAAEGGPDMDKLMALAAAHNVEVLGPPLSAGDGA